MRLNDWPRFGGKGYDTSALCMWLHNVLLRNPNVDTVPSLGEFNGLFNGHVEVTETEWKHEESCTWPSCLAK